ncbi:translation initiation factor IF-2 [Patescibacteria group bacterium]|nr:translation initiation factor IF-2 [Patescibacteria group bacterium]
MGHVDHGKTTLLDTIRKSELVKKEHGGITQHIGAYQVEHEGKKITFIDTPGHAAFARMRARGAQVTDIIVLVVAADDGVKPQTREALMHIRAAKVPFLVAINKVDLPGANIERVKGQLAEEDVVVESYGGDVVCVEVSAKTGKNISTLLEMVQLVADLTDLTADPQAELEAVVIETHSDRRKGPLVSLLVKNGTLRQASEIKIGDQRMRVRAMTDDKGTLRKEAGPSTPVEVLGFKDLPPVGRVIGVKSTKIAVAKEPIAPAKPSLTKKEAEEEVTQEPEEEEERQTIKIVLKADVTGTLEAITSNLSEEVEIIGSGGVGEVNESDVLLALATGATIYAFNTKVSSSAKKLAELEKVQIKTYNVIYKLFEDLERRVLKILEPTIDEEVVGEATIEKEFTVRKVRIAGCRVKTGEIAKNLPIHLKRGDKILKDANIKSLRRGKEDIDVAKIKSECGIAFKPKIDFKVGDMIVSYRKIEDL